MAPPEAPASALPRRPARRDPYSLDAALAVAARLAGLDPAGPPAARLLQAPRAGLGPRVGVLPGSFDPLTAAHVALARAALRHGGLSSLLFLLSVYVVDKADTAQAALADRALVLLRHVARRPRCGVAVCNRGLYVEEAEALAPLVPAGAELWFVVGHDKVEQIFDPRYYADRDAALDRLFALAGLLVAPRGRAGRAAGGILQPAGPPPNAGEARHGGRGSAGRAAGGILQPAGPPPNAGEARHGGRGSAGRAALEALLARPENARYRGRVRPLPLPRAYREESATALRAALAAGADVRRRLAPAAAAFVAATGCYVDPARYAARRAVLARAGAGL